MPNIRQYESQTNITPSNRPASVAAGVGESNAAAMSSIGRNIGEGISALGPVVQAAYKKRVVQPEVSRGALEATRRVDELSRTWDDVTRTADLNDPTIQPKFMTEILEPALEKWRETFQTEEGQEWADSQIISIRNHFSSTTRADAASRAGFAAAANSVEANSIASNVARRDPTSLDFLLDMVEKRHAAILQGTELDAGAAAKFTTQLRDDKQEVVKGGLMGFADRNPNQFLADLAAGKFDKYSDILDAQDMIDMRRYGEARKSAGEEDATAARLAQERQEKEDVRIAVNTIYAEGLETKEDGSIHVKPETFGQALNLAGLPGADENTVTAVVGALRTIQNDELKKLKAVSDPYTVADFNDRLFLADDDPNKLTIEEVSRARMPNAEGQPSLSNADFSYYRQTLLTKDPEQVEDRAYFNEWAKQYTGFINKSSLFSPGTPEAQQRENEFKRQKWEEFRARRKAGKMGREEAVKGLADDLSIYQVPTGTSLQGLTDRAQQGAQPLPPVVPVTPDKMYKPGESMEDYFKRLQGQ